MGLKAEEVEVEMESSSSSTPSKDKQVKSGDFTQREYNKMDDVMGQAWVGDSEEVWRLATVRSVEQDGSSISVLATDEETLVKVSKGSSHPFDPSHAIDMDDLAHLNNMHEAPLLHVLKRRFRSDKIYTTCSDVLISINPYKRIPLLYDLDRVTLEGIEPAAAARAAHNNSPHWFGEDVHAQVQGDNEKERRTSWSPSDFSRNRPHVFTIAARAHQHMVEPKEASLLGTVAMKNQSIIISGESGAGKTEASKYVMRYLITVSHALHSIEGKTQKALGDFIEKCLLRSNTVLEAFGNAKTVRNDNSSRFGKYIKLQYDSSRHLVSAWTDHFLLEKSRLVHVDNDERNYHIFYQLLQGLSQDERESLHLSNDPEDYQLLSQGGCSILEDVDDREEFDQVTEALSTLDVSQEEISSVWRILALLLHFGNLEYEWDEEVGSAVQLKAPGLGLQALAELMGTTTAALVDGIRMKMTSSGRGSILTIPLTLDQTKNNVQAVIKFIYGGVFHWLVKKINSCHSTMTSTKDTASFIGILDIFGFEIMQRNSFEQLCINFANEVLQQQFNMYIFVLEQQEYLAEELEWSVISFRDNQPVIDLVCKKPTGLLIMLEEQGLLARKANNDALLTSYHNTHLGKVECYAKPRFQSDEFIIKHFAGEVTYSVYGFIEKNNDSLHDNLLSLLSESEHPFIRNLFGGKAVPGEPGYIKPVTQKSGGKKAAAQELDLEGNRLNNNGGDGAARRARPKDHSERLGKGGGNNPGSICGAFTVSGTFRRQLDDLTSTLKQTEPHYIKCIKPNNIKAAGGFSSRLVVQQLRYSGVLEVVRIRREAYPTRITFSEFYRRFDVLLGSCKPKSVTTANEYRSACKAIVSKVLPPDGFQLGKRKIFLRDNGLDLLRAAIRDFFAGHAARIQANVRAWIGVRRYRRTVRSIKVVQKLARMHLLRKRYLRYRTKLVLIQSRWRGYRKARDYAMMLWSTIRLQTYIRRRIAMKKFSRKSRAAKLRIETAATRIAAAYRGHKVRVWTREYRASTEIAARYRGYKARTWYTRYQASTCIAARCRGFKARKYFIQYMAATRLAAIFRGVRARRRYRLLRALSKVLAVMRGHVARRQYQKALASCVVLQSAWRCYVARREAHTLRSCVRIQSAWRAHVARRTFCTLRTQARLRREKEERMAACRLQSTWKAVQARRQFLEWRAMAVVLQTMFRRLHAIRGREKALRSIVIIQTSVRRYQSQYLLRRLRAAVRIQTVFRCHSQWSKYRRWMGAIRIQTFYRSRHQRHEYRRLISAIRIQAAARRYICRRDFLRLISAIKIQSQVRGSAARRAYRRLRAVILIQRVWRGKLVHYVYVLVRSALRIQKMMRGWISRVHFRRACHAVRILQNAARHFLKAVCLDQRVNRLHEAARSGMVHVVNRILEERPGLGTLRNRRDRFKTLLHSAAISDDASVATYLNCQYQDLLVVDAAGNTPLHYAAARGNYSLVKLFARLCDSSAQQAPQFGSPQKATPSRRKASFSISNVTPDTLDARRRSMRHKTEGRSPVKAPRRGTQVTSKDLRGLVSDPQAAARIKSGWLRKRRETDRFQRRWVVLTDKELKYYHGPHDRCASKVIQLHRAMLKISENIDFCFELHSPLLLDGRNREGRLYFQAESEMELQAWIAKLRVVVGQISHLYGKRLEAISYVNEERRLMLVTRQNRGGETPLHAVARMGDSCKGSPQVVTWMVENGADINFQDDEGNTPMHLAVAGGHKRLAGILAKKGANLSLRNAKNLSVLELMKESRNKDLMALAKSPPTEVDHYPLLLPAEKLPGCSYMSLLVEKLAMTGMEQLRAPSLSLSVFSAKRHMVEAKQDVIYPAVIRQNYTWWGWTWHMQTPVENMKPGSIAVVELRDRRLNPRTAQTENMLLAWTVIHLDDNVVDSGSINLEMYCPPVDLKLQRLEPADFFLGGEISLSRLDEGELGPPIRE